MGKGKGESESEIGGRSDKQSVEFGRSQMLCAKRIGKTLT